MLTDLVMIRLMQTLDTALIEGQRIVGRKLAAYRAANPSPEMIHQKSLRVGKVQIARKLAAASTARTLTTSTPTPSAPITAQQFKNVCRAAHTAAAEAAKSYARAAKPAEKNNHFLTRHRIFCPGGFTGAKLNGRVLG